MKKENIKGCLAIAIAVPAVLYILFKILSDTGILILNLVENPSFGDLVLIAGIIGVIIYLYPKK